MIYLISDTYLDPKTIDHDQQYNRPRVSVSDAKLETYRLPDTKDSNRKSSVASDVALATNRMNQMATLILSPINDINSGKGGTIQLSKGDPNSIVQFNVQSGQGKRVFIDINSHERFRFYMTQCILSCETLLEIRKRGKSK